MSELRIENLHVSVENKKILNGLSFTVRSGEVHAIMGPNGAGKSTLSHVLAGKPGYTVTEGNIYLDGVDLLTLPIYERAQQGLFLALQYPIEVPGVQLEDMLRASLEASGTSSKDLPVRLLEEAGKIHFDEKFLSRSLNVDFSGGEKKRNETLQFAILEPKFAILDELDSGLDIDALRDCTKRVEQATSETGVGVVAITHYQRLFHELKPDVVHILIDGEIRHTGGLALVEELEQNGYKNFVSSKA